MASADCDAEKPAPRETTTNSRPMSWAPDAPVTLKRTIQSWSIGSATQLAAMWAPSAFSGVD